jgi:hypothetical protein
MESDVSADYCLGLRFLIYSSLNCLDLGVLVLGLVSMVVCYFSIVFAEYEKPR